MSRINLLGTGALLIIAVTVLCAAQKKEDSKRNRWPDLRCHQINWENKGKEGFIIAYHEQFWELCAEREERTGACAEICFLEVFRTLVRSDNNPKNPIIFDVDSFVTLLSEERGYSASVVGLELKVKVRKEIEGCQEKSPDMGQLNVSSSCGPWKGVLDCIDKAYGCPSRP